MKRIKTLAAGLLAATTLLGAGLAQAHTEVSVAIGLPLPRIVLPAPPVVFLPAPVAVRPVPQVVYYADEAWSPRREVGGRRWHDREHDRDHDGIPDRWDRHPDRWSRR